MKADDLRRAYVGLNLITRAVKNRRGRPLTPRRAGRILAPWRALRRVPKEQGEG